MRSARLIAALCALGLAAPAFADDPVRCKDGSTSSAGRGACSHHGGVDGPATAAPAVVVAEPVQCRDGTTSDAAGRGACSHHGGVGAAQPVAKERRTDAPAREPERRSTTARTQAPDVTPMPVPREGQPTAKCRDGAISYSKHHTGTCSNHGGVASWYQ